METSVPAQSTSDRYPRVASPLHTILMLAVFAVWTFGAKILADHMRAVANPNRVRLYLVTIFVEWFFFVVVVAGVRGSGASVFLVIGEHWHSARQVLRDIGMPLGSGSLRWQCSGYLPDSCASMRRVAICSSFFRMGALK